MNNLYSITNNIQMIAIPSITFEANLNRGDNAIMNKIELLTLTA